MAVKSMFNLAGIMTVGSLLVGCGWDGARDTVLTIEENRYVIREIGGNKWRTDIDEHSRLDEAKPSDEIRVFLAKDGYAAYI